VSNDEDRARGNFMAEPQLEKFPAQCFRRENVECGKRFVHEEYFGLHYQRSCNSNALLHPAGKFLG